MFSLRRLLLSTFGLLQDSLRFARSLLRSRTALAAENLFLRKQLAFYQERTVKPGRLNDFARLSLLLWSRLFEWRNALVIVKPETFIGWHKRAFQIFWRLKSRGGRPQIPRTLRALIAEMVHQNPTWGEARVASELALKLDIRVSPRTVRAYWPQDLSPNRGHPSQRWMTFVRNHGKAIVACDFVIAVTFSFRILYIFVVMEVASRRILQVNVTSHPTSSWTLQQLREAIPSDHSYRWLIHDRSGIFSEDLDRDVKTLGVNVLKTPIRAPKANAYCERLIERCSRLFQEYQGLLGWRRGPGPWRRTRRAKAPRRVKDRSSPTDQESRTTSAKAGIGSLKVQCRNSCSRCGVGFHRNHPSSDGRTDCHEGQRADRSSKSPE